MNILIDLEWMVDGEDDVEERAWLELREGKMGREESWVLGGGRAEKGLADNASTRFAAEPKCWGVRPPGLEYLKCPIPRLPPHPRQCPLAPAHPHNAAI